MADQSEFQLEIPKRKNNEPGITDQQRDYIQHLLDEVLVDSLSVDIDALGKWQASSLITKLKITQDKNVVKTWGYSQHVATEARLLKRSCESLLGICAGLLADGALNDDEIRFLNLWLEDNEKIAKTWPGEVIFKRVHDVLADNVITEDERDYLKQTLEDLLGGTLEETGAVSGLSTRLPLDEVDHIEIPNNLFCFTGNFIYGTRAACERAILDRDGSIIPRVRMDLNYLVIGTLASREWAHTSHGRKIEKAINYNKKGSKIAIVDEKQWVQFL